MFFRLWEFDGLKYEPVEILKEVLAYDYTAKDVDNSFSISLKAKYKWLIDYPKPIIIEKATYVDGEEVSLYFNFIVDREYSNTNGEQSVTLKGGDIKFFEKFKILNANVVYTSVDPNALPSDYALYLRTDNLEGHLNYAYNNCFLNPRQVVYGGNLGTFEINRKFKGLDSVVFNLSNSPSIEINLGQDTMDKFKDELLDKFNRQLVTRQYINKLTGLIEVVVSEPVELNKTLVKRQSDLIEEIDQRLSVENYFIGIGKAPTYTNQFDIASTDFTSIETINDYSFVTGDNATYLQNTTKTFLTNSLKNRIINLKKIKVQNAFIDFNVGDVVDIQGKKYLIKQLQERQQTGGANEVDIEIKEQ